MLYLCFNFSFNKYFILFESRLFIESIFGIHCFKQTPKLLHDTNSADDSSNLFEY